MSYGHSGPKVLTMGTFKVLPVNLTIWLSDALGERSINFLFCFLLLFLTCGKVQTVNVLGFVCKRCGLGGNCSSLHEHSHRQNKEEHCGYVPHKVVFAKTAGVPGLKTGQQLLASTRGHGFIASDATVWTLLHPSSVSTLACLVPSC